MSQLYNNGGLLLIMALILISISSSLGQAPTTHFPQICNFTCETLKPPPENVYYISGPIYDTNFYPYYGELEYELYFNGTSEAIYNSVFGRFTLADVNACVKYPQDRSSKIPFTAEDLNRQGVIVLTRQNISLASWDRLGNIFQFFFESDSDVLSVEELQHVPGPAQMNKTRWQAFQMEYTQEEGEGYITSQGFLYKYYVELQVIVGTCDGGSDSDSLIASPTISVSTSFSESTTASISVSSSVSISASISLTPSISLSLTPSITLTPSISVSLSLTPSITLTPSISLSATTSISTSPSISTSSSPSLSSSISTSPSTSPSISTSRSLSSSISLSSSATPTHSVTPSISISSSISTTRTITPSISPSHSLTASPSLSSSISTSHSTSPSISVSSTPFPSFNPCPSNGCPKPPNSWGWLTQFGGAQTVYGLSSFYNDESSPNTNISSTSLYSNTSVLAINFTYTPGTNFGVLSWNGAPDQEVTSGNWNWGCPGFNVNNTLTICCSSYYSGNSGLQVYFTGVSVNQNEVGCEWNQQNSGSGVVLQWALGSALSVVGNLFFRYSNPLNDDDLGYCRIYIS